MRSVWSCRSCVAVLFSAIVGGGVQASQAGPKRDLVHRVAKAQITPPPLWRRDGAVCPADNSLCPDSLGGGCCPPRYECATDSCYATTAGITSACGKEGWFACPAADSGGCCPVGYVCGPNDCSAPVGVTKTITSCPANYSLCPAEMNFGCCQSGMGCGLNACYSTAPVTTTVLQRITTTKDGEVITSTRTATTVTTPTAPPRLDAEDPNVAAKFIPSSVPKTSPSSAPSDGGSSGLTSAQLGGIVGGAVALLIVVLVAAFFIIKRLNRVASHLESSRQSSEKTKSQSHGQQQYLNVSQGYPDDTSIDPLMQVTPNNVSGSATPPVGATTPRGRSGSNQFSPTFPDGSTGRTPRQVSVDSAAGYFDLPPRVQNLPGSRQPAGAAPNLRTSVDSQSTQGQYPAYAYQHHRNQSNASEFSDGSDAHGVTSPLVIQELDSAGYVELPSGDGQLSPPPPPPQQNLHPQTPHQHSRSRSNSGATGVVPSPRGSFQIGSSGGGRRRSGSGSGSAVREVSPQPPLPQGAMGLGPLDVVNEHSEIMTGYYGPRDRQVGQTAAGLVVGMDVSSPVAPGYRKESGASLHPHKEGTEEQPGPSSGT